MTYLERLLKVPLANKNYFEHSELEDFEFEISVNKTPTV